MWICQVTAVVNDDNAKIKLSRQARQRLCHVTRAGNDQAGLGTEDLKEDFQRGPTTAHGLPLVSIQVDMGGVGATLAYGLQRLLHHFAIGFGPGETPAHCAISMNEHLAADAAGRGARGFNDAGYGYALAAL